MVYSETPQVKAVLFDLLRLNFEMAKHKIFTMYIAEIIYSVRIIRYF